MYKFETLREGQRHALLTYKCFVVVTLTNTPYLCSFVLNVISKSLVAKKSKGPFTRAIFRAILGVVFSAIFLKFFFEKKNCTLNGRIYRAWEHSLTFPMSAQPAKSRQEQGSAVCFPLFTRAGGIHPVLAWTTAAGCDAPPLPATIKTDSGGRAKVYTPVASLYLTLTRDN